MQYNYAAAVAAGATGSGNGQKAASCRTDAYAGTDIPYNLATLAQLDGAPGATGGCAITFTPPNAPFGPTFPAPSDLQANVMTIPVAASADALAFNHKGCKLKLTAAQVSGVFGGTITDWSQLGCTTGGAIKRVVRLDKSGTTQIFKNYLAKVDGASAQCDGSNWATLAQDANNTVWPSGGTCTTLLRGATSGNPAVAAVIASTKDTIGYVDLSDAASRGLKYATVHAAVGSKFVNPLVKNKATGAKTLANCDLSSATLPGSTNNDSVGLGTDTWATDNSSGNHGDVTDVGSKYPICGITFDLVYTGLSSTSGSAISGLSLDQRQTLYDLESYITTAQGQAHLAANFYAPLPSTWLAKLHAGFQANF